MAALHDIWTKDSTDRSILLHFYDSTDGSDETVDHATAGLSLWYRREGGAKVAITPAALSALTDAHTDGGVEPVGDGTSRIDVPDAAGATGASYVDFGGSATGVLSNPVRIRLSNLNLDDANSAGLAALTDWLNGGRLDLLLDAIKAVTDVIPDAGALTTLSSNISSILTDTGTTLDAKIDAIDAIVDAIVIDTAEIGVAGVGLTNLGGMSTTMKAQVNTEADTALTDYDAPTKAELDTAESNIRGVDSDTLKTVSDQIDSTATASALSTVGGNVTTILGKWTGITSLAQWLGLMAGKQTPDATALAEIKATGVGSGTFNATTDSQEALRDTEPMGTAMRGTDGANTTTPPTVTAIADQVWDEATADHVGAGSTGAALGSASAPSAAQVADAVWDEAKAGHVAAGSFGEEIQAHALSSELPSEPPTVTQIRTEIDSNSTVASNVTTILGKWTGITSLAQWLGLMAGKQTANATALTEIQATGAGSGTYAATTDSQEAIRDKLTDIETDTNELQADWANGGRLDLLIDAIKVVTDALPDGGALTTLLSNISSILTDTGTTLDAKIDAIDAIVDAIVIDTAEIGVAGVGLTNLGGMSTTMKAQVNAEADTALTDYDAPTKAELDSAIGALNDLSAAQVNAEVVDALATDTYAEPGQGAPAATTSLAAKINYLYKNWRNKKDQTATNWRLYADDGTTVDQKSTASDDGTTAAKSEIVTGP